MKIEEVGHAALSGWKALVADEVARRAPFRDEQVRAALGLVFLGLSVQYLARTTRRLLRRR
jgi:hypothetical protein